MVVDLDLAFPLRPYETGTSYVSRLTHYCGVARPSDLCLDFGFRWQDFIRGSDTLCRQLATISGADPDALIDAAVRTTDRGRYILRGHIGSKGMILRTRLRVCPYCLEEDVRRYGRHGVYRRYFWQVTSIHTCEVHSAPLITLPAAKYTLGNYDFVGQVRKHWRVVENGPHEGDPRSFSTFERYVFGRLRGMSQQPFLDSLTLQCASRLCETLGYVLEFGPEAKLRNASEADMWRAGQVGFAALVNGEQGLLDVLDDLRSEDCLNTMRHKRDFGAFYEWLRLSPFAKENEPLRRIARNYIFEHYPIPEGYEVLGEPCPERSVYSIEAACKALGVNRKRMSRYLLSNGTAERGSSQDAIALTQKVGPPEIQALAEKMGGRIKMPEALELLQVTPKTLLDLCDIGLIGQHLDSLDQMPKYQLSQLQSLLEGLASRAVVNSPLGADLQPLAKVAKRLRCRGAEIVAYVLAGKLTNVAGDIRADGVAGLFLDPEEVRYAIPCPEMPGITRSEAATTLRVTYQTINYLIAEDMLQSARMRNPKSRQFVTGICDGSVERFLSVYDTLGLMARRYRRPSGPFGCHLEANGICPLETPQGISWIFSKRGLEKRIRKLGISMPA